jgi:hypothetical protein
MSVPEATLKWGIEDESCHRVRSSSVGAIVQLNDREFLGVTTKELVRFESSQVIDYYPLQLTSIVCVPEHDVAVGVTSVNSEFLVFPLNDIRHPIRPGVRTDDATIFNMISCANTIITCGELVKSWHFCYERPAFEFPRVSISLRAVIAPNRTTIMNTPLLDRKRGHIFVSDGSNLLRYTLDGHLIDTVLPFQCASPTTIGMCDKTHRFFTTNCEQGAILWSPMGTVCRRFLALGVTSFLAIRFLNSEFALFVDSNGNFVIVDVRTFRVFDTFSVGRLSRIFVFYPKIIVAAGSTIRILRAVLPWKLWASTISRPVSLQRCPKSHEAARLLAECSGSHIKIFSPSTSHVLTTVTVQSTSCLSSFHYDRGRGIMRRDEVLVALRDGTMPIFATGENPCKQVDLLQARVTTITTCQYKNELCFAFGTLTGHVLYYDYKTMKPRGRSGVLLHPISCLLSLGERLVIGFPDRLVLWSVPAEKVLASRSFVEHRVAMTFDDAVVFGLKDGKVAVFVVSQMLADHDSNGARLHDDAITSFSRGSVFFVSASVDRTVRVWTNDFALRFQLGFPLPLYSVAVLNGKRDLLIGTESEIMFVNGDVVFHGEVDAEDQEFDNFDKLHDLLETQCTPIEEDQKVEEADDWLMMRKREQERNVEQARIKPRRNRLMSLSLALQRHEIEKSQVKFTEVTPKSTQPDIDENKLRILREMATMAHSTATVKPVERRTEPEPEPEAAKRVVQEEEDEEEEKEFEMPAKLDSEIQTSPPIKGPQLAADVAHVVKDAEVPKVAEAAEDAEVPEVGEEGRQEGPGPVVKISAEAVHEPATKETRKSGRTIGKSGSSAITPGPGTHQQEANARRGKATADGEPETAKRSSGGNGNTSGHSTKQNESIGKATAGRRRPNDGTAQAHGTATKSTPGATKLRNSPSGSGGTAAGLTAPRTGSSGPGAELSSDTAGLSSDTHRLSKNVPGLNGSASALSGHSGGLSSSVPGPRGPVTEASGTAPESGAADPEFSGPDTELNRASRSPRFSGPGTRLNDSVSASNVQRRDSTFNPTDWATRPPDATAAPGVRHRPLFASTAPFVTSSPRLRPPQASAAPQPHLLSKFRAAAPRHTVSDPLSAPRRPPPPPPPSPPDIRPTNSYRKIRPPEDQSLIKQLLWPDESPPARAACGRPVAFAITRTRRSPTPTPFRRTLFVFPEPRHSARMQRTYRVAFPIDVVIDWQVLLERARDHPALLPLVRQIDHGLVKSSSVRVRALPPKPEEKEEAKPEFDCGNVQKAQLSPRRPKPLIATMREPLIAKPDFAMAGPLFVQGKAIDLKRNRKMGYRQLPPLNRR